MKMSLYVI